MLPGLHRDPSLYPGCSISDPAALGKATEDCPRIWASDTEIKLLARGFDLAIAAILVVNQWVEALSLFLPFSFSISLCTCIL